MRMMILMLVLLCAVTSIGMASPSIVWSGVQDIESGYSCELELDLDMNGSVDFMFRHSFYDTEAFALTEGNEFFCTLDIEPEKYPPAARRESAGTLFDDSPVDPNVWYDDTFEGYSQIMMSFGNGYWAYADHDYMGVRFQGDAGLLYGWIEIGLDGDAPYGLTINSWAYETQLGVGIVAGMVPEPSSWALFLTGLGCLLGRAINRRSHKRA